MVASRSCSLLTYQKDRQSLALRSYGIFQSLLLTVLPSQNPSEAVMIMIVKGWKLSSHLTQFDHITFTSKVKPFRRISYLLWVFMPYISGKFIVLKMCNALLKRLSKSCNPEVGYGVQGRRTFLNNIVVLFFCFLPFCKRWYHCPFRYYDIHYIS